MKHVFYILCFCLIIFSQNFYAQDTITFKTGKYAIYAEFDTTDYCSSIKFYKNDKLLSQSECGDKVTAINSYDIDGDGTKEIVIEYYTGGAHCCTYVTVHNIISSKLVVRDTLFWGDSGYEFKDLDKDGTLEVIGYNTAFAYAFTNFALSYFPIAIYRFRNGKFVFANEDFPNEVKKDIEFLKGELQEYIIKGFECPQGVNDDTFNTDAGAVKAILGPIVFDYHSIGETQSGYDYLKKIYKCNDQKNFIKILQEDFKLK